MARKTIGPLSLADLRQVVKDPRFDHPSRKSIVLGQQALLPKRRKPVWGVSHRTGFEQTVGHESASYGEFVPNPPECTGLRRITTEEQIAMIERMKALKYATAEGAPE